MSLKTAPHDFENMDGEPHIVGYIEDAQQALYHGAGVDASMPSHAIDFAMAILYAKSETHEDLIAQLAYVINELTIWQTTLKRNRA